MLELSTRQEKFVHHYLETENGAESARLAGYSHTCARQTARSLLIKPEIQTFIRQKQDELRIELKIERQNIVLGLIEAFQEAKSGGQPQVMVAAMREIGRICGLYQESVDNTQIGQPIDIQSLSDQELQQLLETENMLV